MVYQVWNKFNIKIEIIFLNLKSLYVMINKYQKLLVNAIGILFLIEGNDNMVWCPLWGREFSYERNF
jgi:hypothetical protein